MGDLVRVSMTIEKTLLRRFEKLRRRGGHRNRSEALRDLIRNRLVEEEWAEGGGPGVATVTLIYDHDKRDLSERLVAKGHQHHGEVLATMHIHLDERNCLEVIALRGRGKDLIHLAEHLVGMKGVKHGKLVMSSAAV